MEGLGRNGNGDTMYWSGGLFELAGNICGSGFAFGDEQLQE
jgi:hypothetical protein